MHTILQQLETQGYAILRLSGEDARVLKDLYGQSASFFAKTPQEKAMHARPGTHIGWRDVGVEFSQLGVVDLNESFTLWRGERKLVPQYAELPDFMDALEAYTKVAARLTHNVFEEIGRRFESTNRIEFETCSHVQVNASVCANPKHWVTQALHEDAHALTFHNANGPGLEILVDGRFVPLSPKPNEVIIMPGSILTWMTGGRVKPLHHQARRSDDWKPDPEAPPRLAALYFVNPDIGGKDPRWVNNKFNDGVDILKLIRESPTHFGLPETQPYEMFAH